jgi:hypothetical protein
MQLGRARIRLRSKLTVRHAARIIACALFALSIMACAALLTSMRRATET